MGLFDFLKRKNKQNNKVDETKNMSAKDIETMQRKQKINQRICLVLQGNFGVTSEDDYDTNLKRIEQHLLAKPENLGNVLSCATLDFLLDLCKKSHASTANKLRKRCEDFQLLANLGIFEYGSLNVKSAYKMFILQNQDVLRKIALRNDLIIGMVDYYGLIEITKANELLNNKYDVTKCLNESLLARLHIIINKDIIYRKEILNLGLKEFKELRKEFDETVPNYAVVSEQEYISFAHRFLKEDIEFEDPILVGYFDKKLFVLDTDTTTHLKEHGLKPEGLDEIEIIDANTPKWILKGYTKVGLAIKKAGLEEINNEKDPSK